MATKKTSKSHKAVAPVNTLDTELYALQSECDAVERRLVNSRIGLYLAIAKVYFWWRKASAQKGYLEAKKAQMGGTFDSYSKHGYNFSPVLQLAFGNVISQPDKTKRGRLLNILDKQYKKQPRKYGNDPVKLAAYIQENDGIDNLLKKHTPVPAIDQLQAINKRNENSPKFTQLLTNEQLDVLRDDAMNAFIAQEISEATMLEELVKEYGHKYLFVQKPKQLEVVRLTAKLRQSKLADIADKYWKENAGLSVLKTDYGFETDDNNFGLALVKRDKNDITFIDSFIDPQIIKAALVRAYEKQFSLLPVSVRSLYETLRTQLLPEHIASNMKGNWSKGKVMRDAWQKKGNKNVTVKVPVTAYQRLTYCAGTNEFLLSPIATDAGVSVVVKPTSQVIAKCNGDVFLAHRSKGNIELQVLDALNMNCYLPEENDSIPAANDHCSHRIKITSIADISDFHYIDFYHLLASSPANYGQALFDNVYEDKIKTKFTLPAGFMHHVAKDGADKWLAGKGFHFKRPSNLIMQVEINGQDLHLRFDFKKGKPYSHFDYQLPIKPAKPISYKQEFVSVDLMPVLSCLGALQLITDVDVMLDANVLVFKFATAAGSFVIAVPTCDAKGERTTSAAFKYYKPTALTLDEEFDLKLETYYASNPEDLLIDLDFNPPKSQRVYEYE